jgi:ketosteroid isomerase-like protein
MNYSFLRPLISFIICLAICSLSPGLVSGGQRTATDEIRSVLDKQVAAWNRGDLEEFMEGYWRSEKLSFYSGTTRTSGWQTTLTRYRDRYQSSGREMGQLTFSEIETEILSPTSAFVRGQWKLKMSASEPGGLFTLVFRKLDGKWKIVHDHTSN